MYLKKTVRLGLAVLLLVSLQGYSATYQATGFKVGEVDQNSAIIWTRCTQNAERDSLTSSVPGKPGYVRVRYSTDAGMAGEIITAWEQIVVTNDYTYQFALTNLISDQDYYLATDVSDDGVTAFGGGTLSGGAFHTAAAATQRMDVTFAVITGTEYADRAVNEVDGFDTQASVLALDPHFIIPTGDTVYYDHEVSFTAAEETGIWDEAKTPTLARYRWNRYFALPRTLELFKNIPAYWCVDDHDIIYNDCWPGTVPDGYTFSFADGVKIFYEQVPLDDRLTYRTKRWGKDLQIWMTEGRFYRDRGVYAPAGTPSDYPSMWGDAQKQWFKDTVATNDATWKVLISPTPFIGPDYKREGDNYAYFDQPRTYDYEGEELRGFIMDTAPADMFVVCGDRHWQYHAIDPVTQLHEFSCGPASDNHTYQGTTLDPAYQSFHQDTSGGFATVEITNEPNLSTITFRIYDDDGAILHTWSKDAFMPGEDDLGSMIIPSVSRDANFKLQLSETTNDHIHVTGDLDLGDSADLTPATLRQTDLLLSVLPGETLLGSYTLVTYTGSLSGSFARVTGLPEDAILDYSRDGEISLILDASIGVTTNTLTVSEGGTQSFGVRMTQVPAGETTITVSRVSGGDTNITIQGDSTLVFTTNDWNVLQYIVVAAGADDDWDNGSAIINCSASSGVPDVDIDVTEADSDYSRNFELPWSETFESAVPNAGMLGDVTGRHGWSVSGDGSAMVQSNEVQSGSQALAVSDATASHTFTGNSSNVWITLWAKPVIGEIPATIPSDTAAAFYINTNMHLMAYDSNAVIDTAATVSNGWNKFELNCDYSSKVWNLELNNVLVVSNFTFYGAPSAFQVLELIAESTNAVYIDDFSIAGTQGEPDTDSDGLPDSWEIQYFGGSTNADANATASNGVNTVEETYIAGLDPTDPTAVFLISDLSPLSSDNILQWQGVSGRVYTVYWTSNLLSGFGSPLTNGLPWTPSVFTDTTHGADQQGFYKIKVEVE